MCKVMATRKLGQRGVCFPWYNDGGLSHSYFNEVSISEPVIPGPRQGSPKITIGVALLTSIIQHPHSTEKGSVLVHLSWYLLHSNNETILREEKGSILLRTIFKFTEGRSAQWNRWKLKSYAF